MTKRLLAMMFFATMALSLWASEYDVIEITNEEPVCLSQVDAPKLWLRLDYPGHISSYCGIKIHSSSPMEELMQEFDFDSYPSEITRDGATFMFQHDLYVGIVTMKVPSGEKVKDVLKRRGMTLSASAVPCTISQP